MWTKNIYASHTHSITNSYFLNIYCSPRGPTISNGTQTAISYIGIACYWYRLAFDIYSPDITPYNPSAYMDVLRLISHWFDQAANTLGRHFHPTAGAHTSLLLVLCASRVSPILFTTYLYIPVCCFEYDDMQKREPNGKHNSCIAYKIDTTTQYARCTYQDRRKCFFKC